MRTLNPFKAGVAVGVAIGLWHLAWATLVAVGLAQPFIDFILKLHFIAPFVRVQPFDAATAATLVGITGGLGFLMGLVLALVWNWLHPARRDA